MWFDMCAQTRYLPASQVHKTFKHSQTGYVSTWAHFVFLNNNNFLEHFERSYTFLVFMYVTVRSGEKDPSFTA